MSILSGTSSITEPRPVQTRTGTGTAGRDHFIFRFSSSATACHGFWHDAALVLPSALFVVYLGFHARSNVKPSVVFYDWILWTSLICCSFKSCLVLSSGMAVHSREAGGLESFVVGWNVCNAISGDKHSGILKENYASYLETLARTFMVSGLLVGVDLLLKGHRIFGPSRLMKVGYDTSRNRRM